MSHWKMLTGAASLVLILAACAQAPNEKVAAAEKAVEEARAAGAPAYAPEDYQKLESMLANAKKEIAEQNAKFALTRDYEKAEQLLASAQGEGPKVAETATKKKEEAKVAALDAQKAAQESVKKTQALVAKAPVGKDRAAVEAIKADAQGLASSLAEVQSALDGGDYLSAQVKAKSIQEKSEAVSKEVESALAKVGGAKGKKAGK